MRKNRGFSNGLRSGAWSKNKFTNLVPYSPYDTEMYKIIKENSKALENNNGIIFRTYRPSKGFIHPINEEHIKTAINSIPMDLLKDLRGIFLCGGTFKQKRYSELVFGTYHDYYKSIFLFPFPEPKYLEFATKPKPSICLGYERHGATWIKEGSNYKLQFDIRSLKSFYLFDVLFHEIGHHVENMTHDVKHKTYNQRERYAEWFALEFGFNRQEINNTSFTSF